MNSFDKASVVVVNGCSMTYGSQLAAPEQTCWSSVLAQALGKPLVNLSAGGGSNRRIVRTTVTALPALCREYGIRAEEILFIGMWTDISRTELYDPKHRDLGMRHLAYDDAHWHRIGQWRIAKHPKAQSYYDLIQNERADAVNFLLDYILLESFLKQPDCRYSFVFAWDCFPQWIFTEYAALSAQINESRLLGGLAGCTTQSFYESVKEKFPVAHGSHPLEEAHRYFALERLLPWITGTILSEESRIVTAQS